MIIYLITQARQTETEIIATQCLIHNSLLPQLFTSTDLFHLVRDSSTMQDSQNTIKFMQLPIFAFGAIPTFFIWNKSGSNSHLLHAFQIHVISVIFSYIVPMLVLYNPVCDAHIPASN
eukprot:21679_1